MTISSRIVNESVSLLAQIVPHITPHLPREPIDVSKYSHLQEIELADPYFNQPKQIDMLIGSNVWACIIRDGIKRNEVLEPVAVCTIFGWVILGPIVSIGPNRMVMVAAATHSNDELHELLTRFWEIEKFPDQKFRTKEQEFCELNFVSTVQRISTGRYIVEMPIMEDAPQLGSSRAKAIVWLARIEKSLANKPNVVFH